MDASGLPTPPINSPLSPLPQVPVEDPQLQKPINPTMKGLKRNLPKVIAGALMIMLLIGGGYFGLKNTQQKQTVESQAENTDSGDVCVANQDCTEFCHNCTQGGGECYKHGAEQSGEEVWACSEGAGGDGPRMCPNGNPPTCPKPPTTTFCCKWGMTVSDLREFYQCREDHWPYKIIAKADQGQYCSGAKEIAFNQCYCESASPSPSPSGTPNPSPSPSPSVSPSPSPSPSLSCVDLTKDVVAPKLNDTVTFTCSGANFSSVNPIAQFRHSSDGGTTFSTPSIPIPIAKDIADPSRGNTGSSYNFIINLVGNWVIQCRICTDATATTCTTWGLAN